MPSCVGFADFIFYPNDKTYPAFILELKKNSTPEETLSQIREPLCFGIKRLYRSKISSRHRVKSENI